MLAGRQDAQLGTLAQESVGQRGAGLDEVRTVVQQQQKKMLRTQHVHKSAQQGAAGLLAHAKNPDGGRALLDYMLSKPFQENAAFKQVMYPVLSSAKAPDQYATDAPEPKEPASLASSSIEANLNAWEQGWRDATGQ